MFTIIIGICLLIIIVVAIYVVVGVVYSATGVEDFAPTPISLDAPIQVLSSDVSQKKLLSKGGSTVAGFFNVRFGDRTASSDSKTSIRLLGVAGSFEVTISPTSTQMSIVTNKGIETIDLPRFPQQSWVFLAILRDGRRFDILYNDTIVASHRLDQYPLNVTNPFVVGASGLLGEAIHILVNDRRLSPKQIAGLRASFADTNGAPPQKTTFPMPNLFALSLKNLQVACIPGLPCNPVTSPPANHLKAWSSMYS